MRCTIENHLFHTHFSHATLGSFLPPYEQATFHCSRLDSPRALCTLSDSRIGSAEIIRPHSRVLRLCGNHWFDADNAADDWAARNRLRSSPPHSSHDDDWVCAVCRAPWWRNGNRSDPSGCHRRLAMVSDGFHSDHFDWFLLPLTGIALSGEE